MSDTKVLRVLSHRWLPLHSTPQNPENKNQFLRRKKNPNPKKKKKRKRKKNKTKKLNKLIKQK